MKWIGAVVLLSLATEALADRIVDLRTDVTFEGEILSVDGDAVRMRLDDGGFHSVPLGEVKIQVWPGVRNSKDLFQAGQQFLGEARVHFQAGRYEDAAGAFADAQAELEQIKPLADRFFDDPDQRYHQRAAILIRDTCGPMQEESNRRVREAAMSRARSTESTAATDLVKLLNQFESTPLGDAENRRTLSSVHRKLVDARRDYAEVGRLPDATRVATLARGIEDLLEVVNDLHEAPEGLNPGRLSAYTSVADQVLRLVNELAESNLVNQQLLVPVRAHIAKRKTLLLQIPKQDAALAIVAGDVRRLREQFDRDEHLGFIGRFEAADRKLRAIPSDELIPRQQAEHARLSIELDHLDDPVQHVANRIPTELTADNFEEAHRNYHIIRDFYPDYELAAVIAQRLANFKLQRALQLEAQGDHALAKQAYRDAVAWFPGSVAAGEAKWRVSDLSYRLEATLAVIGLLVLILLFIPPIADAYGRRLSKREMSRRNHYQAACVRFNAAMNRFQSKRGAAGVGIIPKAIVIFLGSIFFVPAVAIFTALYLPVFVVMNFVHWLGLAYRGIFYQCPYHDCGARFREPVHVCSCGHKYSDLYPSFFGIFHHLCLNKHGKTGNTKRLPTLDSLGRSDIERLCGACGRRLLHRSGYEMPVYPIALVGGQTVGKTVYLHQTVDQLEETYNNANSGKRRVYIDSDDDQLRHDDMMDSLRFGELPHKTTQDYAALGLAMNARDLKLRALVHLFDAPGERFGAMESFSRMQVVQFLKGILFFVDVTPFLKDSRPDMIEIAKPSGDDINVIANNLVNGVNMLRLPDVRMASDIPVAVVITKADALPFDRFGNMLDYPDSDHCRSVMLELGADRVVKKLETKFTNLRYFACSALGRSPFPYDDVPFEPAGVVEPLRFLLEHPMVRRKR